MPPTAFTKAYASALATQDWDQVAPLIDEDARVVFSDGTLLIGKDAIRTAYTRNFTTIEGEDYRMTNIHWLVDTPESAAYTFDFHWAGVIQGRAASGAGRGTTVLACRDDRWRLVGEHLGPMPQ